MSGGTVLMQPGGRSAAPIDRRVGDDLAYLVDCRAVLRPHELLVRVQGEPTGTLKMQCAAKVLKGARELELQVWGGSLPYKITAADGHVALDVQTTQGVLHLHIPVTQRGGVR